MLAPGVFHLLRTSLHTPMQACSFTLLSNFKILSTSIEWFLSKMVLLGYVGTDNVEFFYLTYYKASSSYWCTTKFVNAYWETTKLIYARTGHLIPLFSYKRVPWYLDKRGEYYITIKRHSNSDRYRKYTQYYIVLGVFFVKTDKFIINISWLNIGSYKISIFFNKKRTVLTFIHCKKLVTM